MMIKLGREWTRARDADYAEWLRTSPANKFSMTYEDSFKAGWHYSINGLFWVIFVMTCVAFMLGLTIGAVAAKWFWAQSSV